MLLKQREKSQGQHRGRCSKPVCFSDERGGLSWVEGNYCSELWCMSGTTWCCDICRGSEDCFSIWGHLLLFIWFSDQFFIVRWCAGWKQPRPTQSAPTCQVYLIFLWGIILLFPAYASQFSTNSNFSGTFLLPFQGFCFIRLWFLDFIVETTTGNLSTSSAYSQVLYLPKAHFSLFVYWKKHKIAWLCLLDYGQIHW